MLKSLFLFLLIITSPAAIAQEIERTKVTGKIHAPKGDDLEGISVYNTSSQTGTITNAEGEFEIEVAENDRLYITALQYQSFTVVVDKGIVDTGILNIFLNPAINELDEVVVRAYDLSGNVRADLKKIPTYSVNKDWDLSYENLEYGYQFAPDEQTSIKTNAADEALYGHTVADGANVLGIMGSVANLLFPHKKMTPVEQQASTNALHDNIHQRFSTNFIAVNFDLPQDKAVDFLYFVEENGLTEDMLKPENEMELMQFLMTKSKEYKQRIGE